GESARLQLVSVRFLETEHSRRKRVGVETNELGVGCPADPVVDAAVGGAQVGGSFEEHGGAGLTAIHLDRILVGTAAIAFKRRFPAAKVDLSHFGVYIVVDLAWLS